MRITVNTNDPQQAQLKIHGDRILKVLKDAGMIEEQKPLTILDAINNLIYLVKQVSEALYDNSTASHEAIANLREFVGLSREF